ncbi:hypothetical protein VPHD81_0096 [Vibrio phage D81]
MGENYLFLGGPYDGEVRGVRSGCSRVEVPDCHSESVSVNDHSIPGPWTSYAVIHYIKVNAPTDSGLKVVFVPEGTTVAELHRLINRPIHEIIK